MRQFRKARKTNDDNSSPLTDSKGHSVGVVRLGVGAHLGSWVRKGGKSDGLTTSAPISDRCTMHSTCLFFFFLPHSTMPDRARKGILTITSTYLHSPSIGNSLGELVLARLALVEFGEKTSSTPISPVFKMLFLTRGKAQD